MSRDVAVLPLSATLGSLRRKGTWLVPPRVTVRTRLADVLLDFTAARVTDGRVVVDLDDMGSLATIVVPADGTADVDGVRCVAGSVTSKVSDGHPPGRVHLEVRGTLRFGQWSVRHPYGTRMRHWLR